jgi:hypothetical protein
VTWPVYCLLCCMFERIFMRQPQRLVRLVITLPLSCALFMVCIVSMQKGLAFLLHHVHAPSYILFPERRAISYRVFCLDSINILCVLCPKGHRDAWIFSPLHPVLRVTGATRKADTTPSHHKQVIRTFEAVQLKPPYGSSPTLGAKRLSCFFASMFGPP